MKDPVEVAGVGLITAIGNTVRENMRALESDQSGIGALTLFESALHALPVGEVKLSNEALADGLGLSKQLSRTALLGIKAAREAWTSSGIREVGKWRTGLISATTVGGMDKTEKFFRSFLTDPSKGNLHDVRYHSCGSSTALIAADLGATGFLSTINTACSSSVNSILLGARLIREGVLDVVIAGGTDALCQFTLNGFNSLMILDKQPCRPFDANRQGLNLGEGAGFVVLASHSVLKEEKKESLCRIAGFANTNDAFHQTASSPDGRGSFAAMEAALKMAGLKPGEIDYINLHGTGTINNDLSEGTAVRRLFEKDLPRVSSTKSFTGHTLGASGGIEAVLSVLAIQQGCVFSNLRFETPLPELLIIPQTRFEKNLPIRNVMSNSFGFGGNCSSLLLSSN